MALTVVAAACTFLALLLLALRALPGAGWPIDARVRALAVASQPGGGLATIPFRRRVIDPIVESIGHRLASLLPAAMVRRTEGRLLLAGQPMSLAAFYALSVALAVLLAGLSAVLFLAAAEGHPLALTLLPGALFGALGAVLPGIWLSSRARSRQAAMLRALPDSLDLLTICVEAGLGLDGAFQRVAEKQSGPLADELGQMLGEISLGKTRRQALLDLADRTDLDEVRSLAQAVIQAEQLGTSLGRVLRVQAQRLRVRRRQRAEQEARRAPVKMVFPLVFCLMPSLFIFILGPVVVSVVEFLSE